MKFKKSLTCIDMHTAGEAARLITSGLPHISGATIAEKKAFLQSNMDTLRRRVMLEPRGHDDMFGAFLFPPIHPEADIGIVFIDTGGYLNMCGHNSIAAVTAAVETGLVEIPIGAKTTRLVLDTPAGLVRCVAQLMEGSSSEVRDVTLVNVPSFLYQRDVVVPLPQPHGEVRLDIAFGGSFFALVAAAQFGLSVSPESLSMLQELGEAIRAAVNRSVRVQHPQLPHIQTVDAVEFYSPPTHPEAHCKNVVIFGNRQVDRSPCGTGTCAKMASLYARGELQIGDTFVHESVLGTLFRGRLLEEGTIAGATVPVTQDGDMKVVIPEINGSAYITGFNTLLFDERDPLVDGFTLKTST